jgi:gluconolactonase
VARLPTYTEGVAVDHDGGIYVSHADRISKITPQGEVALWAQTPSPNGHKVRPDGTHLVCDRKGAVYLLDAAGRVLRAVAKASHGANDLTLDTAHGGFYFTSPYGSEHEPVGQVYYVDARERATVAADSLDFPNGIVLRPDGKTLLVGESTQNRIVEFPVEAPGRLGAPRLFALMPYRERFDPTKHLDGPMPDGMVLDAAGNLYVAHYGAGEIQVFGPRGDLLGFLPGSGKFTSNLAFSREDKPCLYVSGSVGPTQQEIGLLVRLDLG